MNLNIDFFRSYNIEDLQEFKQRILMIPAIIDSI
jgi:hypothetical protein